jgi:two-component system, probable response regulator PhcQ
MTAGPDYKRFALLFVDDEEQARKYFRMAFEKDFQVLTAGTVEEAWQLVEARDPEVGLVISDQRMPNQQGTELLGRVRRAHPQVVRILTTAYTDLDATIEAVNSGAIFKYVVKPWDIRELRVTLMRAMEYFLLRRERDLLLREKLSTLEQLLIADRVRSLAILAQGLSSQVRNTMTALLAYVALAKEQLQFRFPKQATQAEEFWENVQWEAEDANRHLLQIVQNVASATLEERHAFEDSVPLGELVSSAWSAARSATGHAQVKLELAIKNDLPALRCSRAMLERMFSNLFRPLVRFAAEGGETSCESVRVVAGRTTRVWSAESIVIEVLCAGFSWADHSLGSLFMPVCINDDSDAEQSPDLLAAFFAAHHHGGTIRLRKDPEAGSGFELTLPFSPVDAARPALDEDAVDKLFAELPRWETLEREA